MTPSFEELDRCQSALGELVLRRRRPVSMPEMWVYEVKIDDHFLMSSLVRESEEELARLALRRLDERGGRDGWRVLVGGLGLGHTAATVLASAQVATLEVVEFLPEVIAWHERGLVPLAATLQGDERCRIVQGDCFERLRSAADGSFDAVLIDIDDSPEELLSADHESFYTVSGLREARRCLSRSGVFGLWTCRPCQPDFLELLREAFGNADAEAVHFHNPLLSMDEINTIYVAQA